MSLAELWELFPIVLVPHQDCWALWFAEERDALLSTLESVDGISVADFEKKVCDEMGLIPEIAPRYRTTYFNHIFSSGYAAGYYGYLWAEVLDKDAFSAFQNSPNGIWDLEMSKKFRQVFLERGGSEEPMALYKEFMGREPDSRAMLLGRGLIEDAR